MSYRSIEILACLAITSGIVACSSSVPGTGFPAAGGTTASVGGSTGVGQGGAVGQGGFPATGGSRSNGGSGQGGAVMMGGANSGLGGAAMGGAVATGGSTTGGSRSTGGTTTTGGAMSAGGGMAAGGNQTGGVRATGGAMATGGSTATGGAKTGGATGTGGAPVTGGAAATGGATATGGTTGTCTSTGWAPPSNMSKDLDIVWDYETKTYGTPPASFMNYIWDQLIANKGQLNYCVRIDLETNAGAAKPAAITATQRDQIQAGLEKVANAWFETHMKGYNCFPYGHIPVKIVGWAVSSKSSLAFTDSTPVYTSTKDGGGVPECDPNCGRFFHRDNNYGSCAAGAANHYDLSLWLTNGMGMGGAGGDWGQRVDYAGTMSTFAGGGIAHIVAHEFGHGLGLPDFYSGEAQDFYTVEKDAGFTQTNFVMKAGSSAEVALFDGWMARQHWMKFIKDRYKY